MSIQIVSWNDLIEHTDPGLERSSRNLTQYKATDFNSSDEQPEKGQCCCLIHGPRGHDQNEGISLDLQTPTLGE